MTTFKDQLRSTIGNCIEFNSLHNAVQACLEVLGSRSNPLVTIGSVTTNPEVASAVVRSGSLFLVTDIDRTYGQVSLVDYKDITSEVQERLVLLLESSGTINPSLIESAVDHPTIVVNYCTPSLAQADTFGHMRIFLLPVQGAVVHTQYTDLLTDLEVVQSGSLGTFSMLSEEMCSLNLSCITNENKPCNRNLHMLHKDTYWKNRWEDTPSYPVAEELHGQE